MAQDASTTYYYDIKVIRSIHTIKKIILLSLQGEIIKLLRYQLILITAIENRRSSIIDALFLSLYNIYGW